MRRGVLFSLGEWGAMAKNRLPASCKAAAVDGFFRRVPIRLLRSIWKEVGGYFALRQPKRGEVVVDAGAWTGHFSLIASRLVGSAGKVITIEPQRAMCQVLRERFRRLGIRNVHVVNAALWDRRGEMHAQSAVSSGFSVLEAGDKHTGTEPVCLLTLDEILASAEVSRVDFIKMDIEGAEVEALMGAKTTLARFHPFLAVASYHIRDGGNTSGTVERILKSSGYQVRTGHPVHLTTWAWRDAVAE